MMGGEASCGLSHESVVRQSGRPASQTSLLSPGWPSDQPDWLVQLDTLSFTAVICILIGAAKRLWFVVGSASIWDVRGWSCEHDRSSVELWHHAHATTDQSDTETNTHSRACSGSLTPCLCFTKHQSTQSHM